MINTSIDPDNWDGLHIPNFVSTYLCCTQCVDRGKWREESTGECDICGVGRPRERYWSAADHADPMKIFMDWLLSAFNWRQKVIVLSHGGGRYDMHYVIGELWRRQGLRRPKVMKDGNKFYQIKVPRKKEFVPEIIFRDSFNWLAPLALADLPAALGLSVSDKGWFPYLYNRNENLNVQLDNLPDKELYSYRGFRKKKREAFEVFYEENRQEEDSLLPQGRIG
jgi:hypothetical protein